MKRVDIFCRKLFFICRTIGIDVSISKEVNASEVRTLWRYTNVFIIMLLLLVTKFVEELVSRLRSSPLYSNIIRGYF